MKLSHAQIVALDILADRPIAIKTWNLESSRGPLLAMDRVNVRTANWLARNGLAEVGGGFATITDAGREALAEATETEP